MNKIKLIKIIELIITSNLSDFTGLGIIVYDNIIDLPIEPINDNCSLKNKIIESENISELLIKISNKNSDCHDGFHLMDSDLQLIDISYYFSTPINFKNKPKRKKGSRYRTAFYGSLIKNINCTVSISSNFETYIFIDGKEYTLDEYRML